MLPNCFSSAELLASRDASGSSGKRQASAPPEEPDGSGKRMKRGAHKQQPADPGQASTMPQPQTQAHREGRQKKGATSPDENAQPEAANVDKQQPPLSSPAGEPPASTRAVS